MTCTTVRTVWRTQVSRRRLLEWRISGQRSPATRRRYRLEALDLAPLLAAAVMAALLWLDRSAALLAAAPILLLWSGAPLLAARAAPPDRKSTRLNSSHT